MDHASEKRIVEAAQRGDPSAIRDLIESHQQRLFAFLWRIVRDHHDAEELAQETFVRALEHLATFSSQYRFSTWLFTIGYRLALNSRRKKRALASDDTVSAHIGSDDSQPQETASGSELARRIKQALWAAVDGLSMPQKTAVYLYYREGFGCEQVSEVLGCPVDTVKSHLHRARSRLRETLEPEVAQAAFGRAEAG